MEPFDPFGYAQSKQAQGLTAWGDNFGFRISNCGLRIEIRMGSHFNFDHYAGEGCVNDKEKEIC